MGYFPMSYCSIILKTIQAMTLLLVAWWDFMVRHWALWVQNTEKPSWTRDRSSTNPHPVSECMGTVTGLYGYNPAQSLLQMTLMVLRPFIQNHRGDHRILSDLIPTKKLFWFQAHKWWDSRQMLLTTPGHRDVKRRDCWSPGRSYSSCSVQTLGHHSAVR